jgi:hypothetical protein
MKSTKFIKETSLAAVVLLLFFCGVGNVAAMGTVGTADKWQSEITIYGWLPSIDGELKFSIPGSGGDSATVNASDILDDLNFVFMGTYEGRYNEWSFGADIIYMDVSGSNSTTVNVGPGPGESVNGGLTLKTLVVTGIAGYDVVQTDKTRLALIGGVRYLTLDADFNQTGSSLLPPSL